MTMLDNEGMLVERLKRRIAGKSKKKRKMCKKKKMRA
jgi:hypothetical protein